jgi:transposase
MSTSYIYHAYGLAGYEYQKTAYRKGCIYIYIQIYPWKVICPCCKSTHVIRRGFKDRIFKTLPIGTRRVFLVLKVHRIQCSECGCIRQMKLSFADPKKSYTRTLARFILDLLKMSTIEDVSKHLKMSWNTIKQIQKTYLEKNFGNPDLSGLQQIAIDEISLGKNHKFITLVIDLLSGAVVFIGDGKGADALTPFWEKLKKSKAVISAVAIDMSPAYISAVQANLPDAAIIFDHFHIVKLFNDKLSQLRRELYHETRDYLESQALKGLRWILLKNPENLNEKRNEKELLEKALAVNKPLAAAYYLKEELRQFWRQESKEKAQELIRHWIGKAQSSGVRILQKLAHSIGSHMTGILSYYDYPISTGPLEGTNNKIKTMQRQAYGYRDKEFFKLKIFAIHQTKYALIG